MKLKMYFLALALIFLIHCRFPRGLSIVEIITRRYGRPTLIFFRTAENNYFKAKKLESDLQFLNTCKEYNVIPKFVRFKVHNRNFESSKLYRSWLLKLLDLEIKSQSKKLKRCIDVYKSAFLDLRRNVSVFDYPCLKSKIELNADRKISQVNIVHQRKLRNLGIDLTKKVDVNKVIFNLSSRNLSSKEKEVLALGLDFGLKPNKVNYFRYFLSFERFCGTLGNFNKYGLEEWNVIYNKVSEIANTTYNRLCRNPFRDPVNDERIRILTTLKDDENIIITRPDKGKGVVVMDKCDYNEKMNDILNDRSKFALLNVNFSSQVLKLEDKLNRLLRSIKNTIGESIYNQLRISGSRPGTLYGLPKIHKPNNPLRPIISSIGTFSYNLAKFLVPIIDPLTRNEYTIGNASEFIKELCNLQMPRSAILASFDIESLFTNVPLKETTDIVTNTLFEQNLNTFGLEKKQLEKLLTISTSDSVFTFNNKLYAQVDGVSMGSCLGPSYANAFLCFHEKRWLDDCPIAFKPLYYRRYIDDTFLIFRNREHIQQFLTYLNTRHPNIKFTFEVEEAGKLAFLDTLILNDNGKFSSTVYRKPTYTGLGLNYLSFVPYIFKLNSIKTLLT